MESHAQPQSGPDGIQRIWKIEFFETDAGRKPVLDWIKDDLTPTKRRALGSAMRRVLQEHGPAVVRSSWGDTIDKGLFEFRLRMNGKQVINLEAEIHNITEQQARERFGLDPSEDILLRVFCTTQENNVVLLLHGYDKGKDASKRRQQNEIAEAKKRQRLLRQHQERSRKQQRKAG